MDNMQITTSKKVYFNLKEQSNYIIETSYKDIYIVEFGLFKKIAKALLNSDKDFITIYETILNKKYIYRIEPTSKLTKHQNIEKENIHKELKTLTSRMQYIENKKDKFIIDYFNKKYKGKRWSKVKSPFFVLRGYIFPTKQDIQKVIKKFYEENTLLNKEVTKLLKGYKSINDKLNNRSLVGSNKPEWHKKYKDYKIL